MREKREKVGRPPMPKGEAKGVVLQSRVQPTEKAAYQKAAKSAGVDLSSWIRQTLNQAIKA
jgi:predicted HicB family RNase H-like nuclease